MHIEKFEQFEGLAETSNFYCFNDADKEIETATVQIVNWLAHGKVAGS